MQPPQRVSNLEGAFHFQDQAFNAYITLPDTTSCPPTALIKMTAGMAEHPHPLVRYAGGWAAAEAAVVERDHATAHGWNSAHRQQSLEIAHMAWLAIDEADWAAQPSHGDGLLAARLRSFALRTEIAIAHLPALKVAARYLGGDSLSRARVHTDLSRVRTNLIPIMRTLIDQITDNRSISADYANGIANEVISAWYLQPGFMNDTAPEPCSPLPYYVITPASLREDNHTQAAARSDLMATCLRSGYGKAHVEVGSTKKPSNASRFSIHAGTHLFTSRSSSQKTILTELCRKETGLRTPSMALLMAAASRLSSRFMEFAYGPADTWPE